MAYNTDERLKSYLDTNQLSREQMCRAIFGIDRRFTDVLPRHPRGGPDGGRDIVATYQKEQKAYGAVGFANQANDSDKQKRTIRKKFKDDVKNALTTEEKPDVFVFLTNINFTTGEKDELISIAKNEGFKYCDVMDRERLRIILDSHDGFSIRFQFLGLPLSEAEQASFFAKWGDDINSIISSGFQNVEKKLNRILFLQEASEVLSTLTFVLQLNRIYEASEIGHFRAFIDMYLKEPKHNIFGILFGSSDRSYRMWDDSVTDVKHESTGIGHGISRGQWELYINKDEKKCRAPANEDGNDKYEKTGYASSIGMHNVEFINIRYCHDYPSIRLLPRLRLLDLNGALYLLLLNASLASKLKAVHIYANGYKIHEISESDFKIDTSAIEKKIPVEFSEDELADGWVRIRPSDLSSSFEISFSSQTPIRLFESPLTSDSLASRRRTNATKGRG